MEGFCLVGFFRPVLKVGGDYETVYFVWRR